MPADIPDDRAVVDRIVDGATAVLLAGPDELELHLPLDALPDGVAEGTWVILDREVTRPRVVGIDQALTEDRMEDLRRRVERLKRDRSPGRFDR